MEGVHSDTQVECILAGVLHHVLVGGNARCLQGLAGDLLLLPTAGGRQGFIASLNRFSAEAFWYESWQFVL